MKSSGVRAPPPPVQCTHEGSFREHQCDITIRYRFSLSQLRRFLLLRQCWCVSPSTGIETLGTRVSSFGPLPNCRSPRICPHYCPRSKCPHGFILDQNGCPKTAMCECSRPCDVSSRFLDLVLSEMLHFQSRRCLLEGELSVVQQKECLSDECPLITNCQYPLLSRSTPVNAFSLPLL